MTKVLVFIGTRPEAIKMAPVIKALVNARHVKPVVVSTGQHLEMLQQVVDLFGIPVDHTLEVMRPSQGLAGLTARLIEGCDQVLALENPDFTLVQGDTTTVLGAALCSFYRGIPFGHVEAGLRTGNLAAPFPEEANRVLASRLATLHFAPTTESRDNLLKEGVEPSRIFVTGNTVIDALHLEVARQNDSQDQALTRKRLAEAGFDLRLSEERKMILITGHRRENFGEGFDAICSAIRSLAERFPDHVFVYPVHLNPHVVGPVREALGAIENVYLLPPQPYSEFVALLRACHLVLTDSGGVQEEAPGLGKPVLVMRETTERPEGVAAGTVRLVGTNEEKIFSAVAELLTDPVRYKSMAEAINPYGDGHAAGRIVQAVSTYCSK